MICPLTSEYCQYCSQEKTTRPFTKLEKNAVTGMYVPVGLGKVNVVLGEICNNAPVGKSPWVKDQKECPKTLQPTHDLVLGKGKRKRVLAVAVPEPVPVKQVVEYGQQALF